MQKAPGSCAFAEWLGCRCGFGSCGSYDDDGASRSRCVSGVVGRHVFDGVRRGSGSVDDNVARERAAEEVFKAEILSTLSVAALCRARWLRYRQNRSGRCSRRYLFLLKTPKAKKSWNFADIQRF